MERDREFRKHNWMRKVIYFLLSVLTYVLCYMVLVGITAAVNMLFVIPPVIRMILGLVFFFVSRMMTVHIMNMKWVDTVILQL